MKILNINRRYATKYVKYVKYYEHIGDGYNTGVIDLSYWEWHIGNLIIYSHLQKLFSDYMSLGFLDNIWTSFK